MWLSSVFVRFFKSFNYDYLRKYNTKVQRTEPWESFEDMWYPYVRVPLDTSITTIVGENESGKSCLLAAIYDGISGNGFKPEDFCRHSRFFTVERGRTRNPHFGFEWTAVSEEERTRINDICGADTDSVFDRFLMFRTLPDEMTIYIPNGDGKYSEYSIAQSRLIEQIVALVPTVFRLKSDVALPETVPIAYLADDIDNVGQYAHFERGTHAALVDSIKNNWSMFETKESVTAHATQISDLAKPPQPRQQEREDSLRLAHDLVRKVARIDEERLKHLEKALASGGFAFADSIIRLIDRDLNKALNFPKFWAQDKDFRLHVSPHQDASLAFTISDRTGTQYAFAERSSGLRYFLSYYVQYLAYTSDQGQILIMDEPDTYLSSQGQQDLLKIFQSFAFPSGGDNRPPVQVVYVTHSPFLIDKNHADRIRVVGKGADEEGTRVVRNVSRNHYEPLRSAFGSFVAETTFIGNCNIMVEGVSDQILIAGAARYLRTRLGVPEMDTLDLNRVTLVPSGGASEIPYLVFLALHRDIERPAVIVLLDSDTAGDNAKKVLVKGVALSKKRIPLLNQEYILQIGDVHEAAREIEDLLPLELVTRAAQRYLREYCQCPDEVIERAVTAEVQTHRDEGQGVMEAINAHVRALDQTLSEFSVDKIGFARAVIAIVMENLDDELSKEFGKMMRGLLKDLNLKQRNALRERTETRVTKTFERLKKAFVQDHPASATREEAYVFFEEIEAQLDNSRDADDLRIELAEIRREFKIDDEPTREIDDYEDFKTRLTGVQYASRLATQD